MHCPRGIQCAGWSFWRRGPESNRTNRICNPGHNRFATAPKNRPLRQKREATASLFMEIGAGKESRTLDLNLGKVALYQLSYSRIYRSQILYSVCLQCLNCSAISRLRKKKPLNVSRNPALLQSPSFRLPQPPRRPPPPHRSAARACGSMRCRAPCRST